MFLSWRMRWETVWAASVNAGSGMMYASQLAYRRAPPSVQLLANRV
jgi:hypothetical protein